MNNKYFIILLLVLFVLGCGGIKYKNNAESNNLFKLNKPIIERGKIAVLSATNHDIDIKLAELLTTDLIKLSKFTVVKQKTIEQNIAKYPINFNLLDSGDEVSYKELIKKSKYIRKKLGVEYLLLFWHKEFNAVHTVMSDFDYNSGTVTSFQDSEFNITPIIGFNLGTIEIPVSKITLDMVLKYNVLLIKYPESIIAGFVKSRSHEIFQTSSCMGMNDYPKDNYLTNYGAMDFFKNISKDIVTNMLKQIRPENGKRDGEAQQ